MLLDGNGCLYPLCKDDAGQMREPQALNMLPMKTAAMGVHHVREGSPSVHRVLLTAFVSKPSPTMTAVLQCNQQQMEVRLAEYENNPEKEGPLFVAERCDGNRNILHALVSIGKPTANSQNSQSTSNKEEVSTPSRHPHSGMPPAGAAQTSFGSARAPAVPVTQSSSSASGEHPITSLASNILPMETERVLAQFDSHNTAASTAIHNSAEILRRLREEVNAATDAARRQFSIGSFENLQAISWPPDPPAYESIPLSSGKRAVLRSNTSFGGVWFQIICF